MTPFGSLQPNARSLRPAAIKPSAGWISLALGIAAVLACVAAVPERFSGKASGAAHPRETESGSVERWHGDRVEIVVDASLDKAGPGGREAAQRAFGNWLTSGANLPELSFELGDQPLALFEPDGKNSVVFADIDIKGHKKDLALTIGFVDAVTGQIREADIVVNSRHAFATSDSVDDCGADYDLESVVTHEVGHFFGLSEDVDDSETTMYFATKPCNTKKRDLAEPDRHSMTLLYSTPIESSADEAKAGCAVSCPTTSGGVFALVIAAALALVARRARS